VIRSKTVGIGCGPVKGRTEDENLDLDDRDGVWWDDIFGDLRQLKKLAFLYGSRFL
jgi:hypothetical protein